MSDLIYLNNFQVPENDIKSLPMVSETMAFDGTMSIPDGGEIVLGPASKYDPKIRGSILFGTRVIGLSFNWFRTDLNRYLLRGKIRDVKTDMGNAITIDVVSNIYDLNNAACTYQADRITPAEALYNILSSKLNADPGEPISNYFPYSLPAQTVVPVDQIIYEGFNDAIIYQKANSLYVNIAIDDTKSNNNTKTCGEIITKLLKISHSSMFSRAGCIYLIHYPYNSASILTVNSVMGTSYSDNYSQDNSLKIINDCRIAWDNDGVVNWVVGSDDDSIKNYGKQRFLVPEDQENSSGSSDYSIIWSNKSAAEWCRDMAFERFVSPSRVCSFDLPYKYSFIKIGNIVNLNFDPFEMTPVLITGIEESPNKKIACDGLFI